MRFALLAFAAASVVAQAPAAPPIELFLSAAANDDRTARAAMDRIAAQWRDAYASMIIDMARQLRPAPRPGVADITSEPAATGDAEVTDLLSRGADTAPASPTVTRESLIRSRLIGFLEKQTGKRFDPYLRGWREWMWTLPSGTEMMPSRPCGFLRGGTADTRPLRPDGLSRGSLPGRGPSCPRGCPRLTRQPHGRRPTGSHA